MHVTVVNDAVLAEHPWVARSLFTAIEEAKRVCYARMREARRFPYGWMTLLREEQEAILGPDPWACGVESNPARVGDISSISLTARLTV